ncbi:ubiquinol-cytochrome c reductase cytochrome b subunit [Streptomyces albus subsp. chlorinus]|uniref:cytochrome bc1 complex cytochrome b subunit n=1 Tax=Streptomyces albus TaxID=1888 RepID=UPI001570C78C|nr:cytochrome b N-terminal domain-containing protein [Streptomyces albus]NSC24680.1 ubiquinol-cytochrome c reductase cytochrome b subunit [Streptomyces albus subsp. chlorinus]
MGHARARAARRAALRKAAERGFRAADDRLPVAAGGRVLLRKAFPEHWSFLLGELALYSFLVLLLTGVYLTLFFDADMTQVRYAGPYEPLRGHLVSTAYASTLEISFEVRGGLLIRQVHHWAALIFLGAIGVHMLRIFFTGAFRKPRDVNWLLGMTLFVLALAEGFSGYSLPDDLLSGIGLRIAQGIMLSIPVVGTYVALFVFGGQFPGDEIIERLYPLHILLLPGLLVALVVAHVVLVVVLQHTHWSGPGRTNRNVVGHAMVPQFAARSTGLFFMVAGVIALLGAVAQINPVWDYGPYTPSQASTAAQPDWYVGFLEGSLRLMPPFETNLFGHTVMWNVLVPAVILPGLLFLLLYAYPFFEQWITGGDETPHVCDRPRNRPVRTALGVAGVTFYGVLLLAGGNDVIAHTFDVSLNGLTWGFRVALVLAPPVAFALTRRLCLALQKQDAERVTHGEETSRVRQSLEGTFSADHDPLPQGERFRLAAQRFPRPLEANPGAARVARLRAALSRWYYQGAVSPAWQSLDGQRERAQAALTGARPEKPAARRRISGRSARTGTRIRTPRRR